MARNPSLRVGAQYSALWLLVPAATAVLVVGFIVLLGTAKAPDPTPVLAPSVEEPTASEPLGA